MGRQRGMSEIEGQAIAKSLQKLPELVRKILDNRESIKSVAIIPLVAGANLGLIGLGANNTERFGLSMGTDFLSQIGDLISASLAVHLEN